MKISNSTTTRNLSWLKSLPDRIHPARFFWITGLIWGSIMVMYIPIHQVPDEPAHSLRAWQLSVPGSNLEVRGNAIGSELPTELLETFSTLKALSPYILQGTYAEKRQSMWDKPLQVSDKSFLNYPNTALYSPVAYMPQALGITAGRLLGWSALKCLLLGRFFNLIFWLGLVYTGIRLMPRYAWLMVFLALWPMSVHQAASLSADAVVNGLSFLWIGMVFRAAFVPGFRLGPWAVAPLALVGGLLCLTKNVYAPLVGLLALIPIGKAERPVYYFGALAVVGACALGCLLWSAHHVRALLSQVNQIEYVYGVSPETPKINPEKQAAIVFADVPAFLSMVWTSFAERKAFVATTIVGVYGWLNVPMPAWYYRFAALFVCLALLSGEKGEPGLSMPHRALLLLLVLAVLLAFSFTMYMAWCDPGAKAIDNLQGRYFIPIAPLLLFLLRTPLVRLPARWTGLPYMAFAVLSGLVAIRELWYAFYYPNFF